MGGSVFTLGATAVGLAALNTGNNLLYLLFGSMLGFIAVSSWLSEQAIRDLRIERHTPRFVTVGHDCRIAYDVTNLKRRLPSLAIELSEAGLPKRAFLPHVPASGQATARSVNSFVRRGIYPLGVVTLSTGFPFGLFRKERDVVIHDELVVWPRTDRAVREASGSHGRVPREGRSDRSARSSRGEYRGLRPYRVGEDARDIHWRSSARLAEPVVREFEDDGSDTSWICLDLGAPPGEAAEVAVEVAAALLARAANRQKAFALQAGTHAVSPGDGVGQLERALDVLARVDFDPEAPAPAPPVDPRHCVLVSVFGRPGFGDSIVVGPQARLERESKS
jgi:uncharacterized protein (DUF58 family)